MKSDMELDYKQFISQYDDNDDHVDKVRLRLWTAATNGPIVYPPGDMWEWKTMVEWCRQRKTPDSSTRALWQAFQQSYLVATRRNGRRGWWIWLCEVFCSYLQVFITCHNILHGLRLYFSANEVMLRICIALKNPSARPCLNPVILGLMTSPGTTPPPRRVLSQ
jgi:hypothetical protein